VVEDLLIGRGRHPEPADVYGVVTGAVEVDRDRWREHLVDQGPQPGKPQRSRTAA
jgi:hypothetical protein